MLLNGCQSWKTTEAICHKLDTFQYRCLRRILNFFWPNTISNAELPQTTSINNNCYEVKKEGSDGLAIEPSTITGTPRIRQHQ